MDSLAEGAEVAALPAARRAGDPRSQGSALPTQNARRLAVHSEDLTGALGHDELKRKQAMIRCGRVVKHTLLHSLAAAHIDPIQFVAAD
jgi:hypothetical protein